MRGNGYGSYRALKIEIKCIQSMIALYRIASHRNIMFLLWCVVYLSLYVLQCTYCCMFNVLTAARTGVLYRLWVEDDEGNCTRCT